MTTDEYSNDGMFIHELSDEGEEMDGVTTKEFMKKLEDVNKFYLDNGWDDTVHVLNELFLDEDDDPVEAMSNPELFNFEGIAPIQMVNRVGIGTTFMSWLKMEAPSFTALYKYCEENQDDEEAQQALSQAYSHMVLGHGGINEVNEVARDYLRTRRYIHRKYRLAVASVVPLKFE